MAAVAGILMFASACDKQAVATPALRTTSIAGKPSTLFLLFGDRGDPRLLPVALVSKGRVVPIVLDSAGWHEFDRSYFAPGSTVSIYRDGTPLPAGTIRRGMWSDAEPLYKLPYCRLLRPLGAVTLAADPSAPAGVELLATSVPMAPPAPRTVPTAADLDSARAFASRAAQRAGLTRNVREELDLRVQALQTGATDRPTLVATYTEKGLGGGGLPRHIFALADIGVEGYSSTFSYSISDAAPEFRRVIDHLDITGDGVDEIVLEGYGQRSESFLVILQFTQGRWHEAARSTSSWCADPKVK